MFGKYFSSIRQILWLITSTLTLLIGLLVTWEVYLQWMQLHRIETLKDATLVSNQLFDATEKILIERDVGQALLANTDTDEKINLFTRLIDRRAEADAAFDAMISALNKYHFEELEDVRQKITEHMQHFRGLRNAIDSAINQPENLRDKTLAKQAYTEATALAKETRDVWVPFIRHFTDIDVRATQHLRYRHFLRIISDYTGRERLLIGRLLAENRDPTAEEVSNLLRWRGAIELGWEMAELLAGQSGLFPGVEPEFRDAQSQYQTLHDMLQNIFYVPGSKHGKSYPINTDLWFELSEQSAESLHALEDASKKAKLEYVEMLEHKARQSIAWHVALLFVALALSYYCFRIINRRVIRPINIMIDALTDATQGKALSVIPPALKAQDEIGKLANILYIFQQNAELIKSNAVTLEGYTRALERSNKELDDFAYIASHDLKEPLRGIHNHSRFLLEDNEEKLDPDSVQRLGRVLYLSQRMEKLVNDLLYFSRLGRQELSVLPTDMNAVIHDIESMLDAVMEESHARIIIPSPLPAITCDQTRIVEVFRNLITNAFKYNDKPQKIVEIGFLDTQPGRDGATEKNVFYVKDNGRGIGNEFYDEIFRIFKRLQSGSGEVEDGTGVGLTFVKKIIERHGGKIWLESEIGTGTTFYFTLGE